VARAAAKAIQGAFEEPIFIFLGVWIADGWLDNPYFVCSKNALAVILFECASALDGHTD
jgi:hypothetical protein